MRNFFFFLLICGVAAGVYYASGMQKSPEPASADTYNPQLEVVRELPNMEQAAIIWLQSLDPAQYEKAHYEFETEERKNWHFVPKVRKGLPMREMDSTQRLMALQLLTTVVSEQGYQKVNQIFNLENVLTEIENRVPGNDYRNPELYYLAVFGDPATDKLWAWRLEGHHLSLNFSSIDRVLSVNPAFMGSNPAIVRSGSKKGMQVLKDEQNEGRKLVKMLNRSQRNRAIISPKAPSDIVTFVDKEVNLRTYDGLQVSEMDSIQKDQLMVLLHVYIDNMEQEIAMKEWARIQKSGIQNLYFAWAGSVEEGKPHYYRIHGPQLLVEYDNTQNNANHIHTVWRNPLDDFGEDLLRKHYQEAHKH